MTGRGSPFGVGQLDHPEEVPFGVREPRAPGASERCDRRGGIELGHVVGLERHGLLPQRAHLCPEVIDDKSELGVFARCAAGRREEQEAAAVASLVEDAARRD
jgi:hypothetical protein